MESFSVLLIDDEEELVSTLKERLGYRGVIAEFLTNGSDAIKRLKEKRFDVIVLDLKMPGIGGIEVMEIVNREYPDTPVILLTGHGTPGQDQVEIPEGAFDYLPKPVSIDILIQKMREAVKG